MARLQPSSEVGVDAAPGPASAVDGERPSLARWQAALQQPPSLRDALAALARRSRWWLAADAALVVYGAFAGRPVWVLAGLLAGVLPFVLTAWNFRHVQRYQRLLQAYAVGRWDAVRALARSLRSASAGKPALDFDLDVRLASIYARDHALADALRRLEPWRSRWAREPGHFEQRVAAVHHMAGDTPGFVAMMAQAAALNPKDAARRVDHALAEARFGDAERADSLLSDVVPATLPPQGRAFVLWAQGLVLLRRAQPEAEQALGDAVAAFLQASAEPATWTALALCACDHAIAMQRAGRREAARGRIAEVWPILEAHAPLALLRMLESDGLLPERAHTNT